jgi:hypothetical protein
VPFVILESTGRVGRPAAGTEIEFNARASDITTVLKKIVILPVQKYNIICYFCKLVVLFRFGTFCQPMNLNE